MAEVNVNQQPSPSSSSGSTWIVALLVVIVLAVVVWFVLGRPGGTKKTDVNVDINVPSQNDGGAKPGGNTGR
jgi:flagellar basal body-associated protein FliL